MHGQYSEYTKSRHFIAIKPNGNAHFHVRLITLELDSGAESYQKSAGLSSTFRLKQMIR